MNPKDKAKRAREERLSKRDDYTDYLRSERRQRVARFKDKKKKTLAKLEEKQARIQGDGCSGCLQKGVDFLQRKLKEMQKYQHKRSSSHQSQPGKSSE